MLKLKLQYFGHLMRRADSFESPREGHSNPLQNSCLEDPMDRGAWQATVQFSSLHFSRSVMSDSATS